MSHKIKRTKIDTNLYYFNGVIYVEKSQGRKIILKRKSPYQGTAAINKSGKPTRELLRWRDDMIYNIIQGNTEALTRSRAESYPSVDEVIDAYKTFAQRIYEANGSPRPISVKGACRALKTICHRSGLGTDISIDKINHDLIIDFVISYENKASGWSNINNAKCMFAKWTRKEYQRAGIKLPELDWPKPMRNQRKKYERPSKDLREKTLILYNELEAENPAAWCAMTLSLNFACRRADAVAMRFDCFQSDGLLRYRPIKLQGRTNETRDIIWPVQQDLIDRLITASGHEYCIPADTKTARTRVVEKVVKLLRGIGWQDYDNPFHEMRKLCCDAVYRKLGLEKACQISGDNPATVVYYYSDPRLEDRTTFDITSSL